MLVSKSDLVSHTILIKQLPIWVHTLLCMGRSYRSHIIQLVRSILPKTPDESSLTHLSKLPVL